MKKAQGILNKLTRQNFDRLSKQLLETGLTSESRIRGVTDLVFKKALDEEFFSSM
jgi:translation initiation factor 4G